MRARSVTSICCHFPVEPDRMRFADVGLAPRLSGKLGQNTHCSWKSAFRRIVQSESQYWPCYMLRSAISPRYQGTSRLVRASTSAAAPVMLNTDGLTGGSEGHAKSRIALVIPDTLRAKVAADILRGD